MSDGRALLTDREREALESDESGSYRYKTRSYIRNRIERLEADAELLAEAEPELFEELQAAVCDADSGGDVQPPADGRESGVQRSQPQPDESVAAGDTPSTPGEHATTTAGDVDSGGAPFADVDFPASKDADECADAVHAAYRFLAEEGQAAKREIVRAVIAEHPAGYDPDAAIDKLDAGDRYRGSWWRKVVKPGLESRPDVEKPTGGASEWEYTGGGE